MDTKQILRNKLKQKIQEKNSERFQLKKKSIEKIKKNVDDEKKEMDTDTRVSYLMKKAGAGDDFKYASSHSQYIAQAVKNRKENNDKKFKAYKPNEVDVKIGDLVCYPRQSGVTYDSGAGYKSHCDLIISINGDVAVGVGGNVSNSVSKKNYALSNGKIDRTKNKDIFTVIKNEK